MSNKQNDIYNEYYYENPQLKMLWDKPNLNQKEYITWLRCMKYQNKWRIYADEYKQQEPTGILSLKNFEGLLKTYNQLTPDRQKKVMESMGSIYKQNNDKGC